MVPARKLSGLQRDVLALYRSLLRVAICKDRNATKMAAETQGQPLGKLFLTSSSSTAYARDQFRREASGVRRSDFKTIEYKIRKGKKQLELLKMPGVELVGGA
mmetsp:Transcript_25509/g.61346  ORF Transcript_25509/g.61346 Transcript_25509/m.61346 type:complete len:103 (-) Transcript_25509:195-503(-)|eukprot:CAMPEP_0181117888 /NCGR_PEP_ID=MMETSP1071-20121207/22776_1 /TAXON_ID=35127 /ORGANISM="Thalassiosira sp., Strain NH16" /LENGTH=102 /DNA_ID=CAMNT_0023202333 /DNA_START=326 /DNA_END=637 /DNA_ORIENTATION=-